MASNPRSDAHRSPTTPLWRDPSVLQRGWGAPVLVGRESLLGNQEQAVLSGLSPGKLVSVSIMGPRGSGTSAVAGHLAATVKSRLTRPGSKGEPLVLRADLSEIRSPASLVNALFQQIQPDFPGKGASAEFLTLLLARRIRTLGRPTIIWVDQVPAKPSGLVRVLGPLADPSRIMPEGPEGLPSMLLVASGASHVLPEDAGVIRAGLPPLQGRELVQAILNRAALAFNAPPSLEAAHAIANLVVARGWGLSMVGELLAEAGRRAGARGGRWLEAEDVALPVHLPRAARESTSFDSILMDVLRSLKGSTSVADLKPVLKEKCLGAGLRLPTQARLWRHLVRLERRGLIGRDVRLGGSGGSSTIIQVKHESVGRD